LKTSEPKNFFELENLEQRIMLSGDPLFGAMGGIAPGQSDLFLTVMQKRR